ncbi:hypothetical protein [Allosphingosinicella indica]|uniref:Uncharacterized protein n=1 Tax=Allosphingosinicella indica TaxID=941907 RepID=A0A1X7G6C1_9SPHN|nr:hypothetical protein [Allosphingosinicella indica]SMF64773.1 hypothetical protein SAMN06295910_1242 [Allosphingosinicella indica]
MRIAALALLVLLAGCGSREPLRPAEGQTPPPVPAQAARGPTTDEMLTPTAIARPQRVDEVLTRSNPREDDRFDLPPSDFGPGAVPLPPSDGPEPN